MADFDRESMLEMFNYEMSQLVDQLEQIIVQCDAGYSMDDINEIFRIMHTIKGSAAMMLFDNIATVAHAMEDMFYYLREENPQNLDFSTLSDIVLEGMDFIKVELNKIESGMTPDGENTEIIKVIKDHLQLIKGEGQPVANPPAAAPAPAASETVEASAPTPVGLHRYQARVYFEDGCEMENIRAYTLIHNLGNAVTNVNSVPEDVIDEEASEVIKKNGFQLSFSSFHDYQKIHDMLSKTVYLKSLELDETVEAKTKTAEKNAPEPDEAAPAQKVPSENARSYVASIYFEDGIEMENVRAFTLVHNMTPHFDEIITYPSNLMEESAAEVIRTQGLKIEISTDKDYDKVHELLSSTIYLRELDLTENKDVQQTVSSPAKPAAAAVSESPVSTTQPSEAQPQAAPQPSASPAQTSVQGADQQSAKKMPVQHVISVNVSKLDQLLNLMGELVIAEAMVTQNPDLEGLELESFNKETRQLRKIINDVQDTVMSMRMVPLSTTFFKMHRIVRDMCKQLGKEVQLEISGEETEVDKNIIEHISDPLMHIIRNSVDHGIEMPDDREAVGKPKQGTVHLEAKNTGGDVLIIVRDNGAGLNRDGILNKAKKNGLLKKGENEYTDKEIHQFIFLPGFSTNDQVTSFSGRGVGMDVVNTNLEAVGGSVLVESTAGEGSTFILKIPLTLAIIEGMTIRMGGAKYTIPIASIKQSFKAKKEELFMDPSGNEMITVRGEVYNVVRLYEFFHVESETTDIEAGIIIMLENGDQTVCLFVDELIGEQQVVVKTMPKYIKKIRGISGCTLLGNGDISLIIDVAGFFD